MKNQTHATQSDYKRAKKLNQAILYKYIVKKIVLNK